jgi:hypothetical protein
MPGLIVGALLASLTYLVGRRVLPGSRGAIEGSSRGSRWISLGAALRIVASATLSYQSGSADGSTPCLVSATLAATPTPATPGQSGSRNRLAILAARANGGEGAAPHNGTQCFERAGPRRHGSAASVGEGLHGEGVIHLLVNQFISPWIAANYALTSEEKAIWEEFKARHLTEGTLVYTEGGYLALYRLPDVTER